MWGNIQSAVTFFNRTGRNCFHLFLTTRVRITDIGIDHGIITANLFPIADFASIYSDHLLIGKIANRILRIDEEHEGVLCYGY